MKEPIKHHLYLVNLIERLQLEISGTLSKKGTPLDNYNATITRRNKGFDLTWAADVFKFRDKRYSVGKWLKSVRFDWEDYSIIFKQLYIRSHQNNTSSGSRYVASAHDFHSRNFKIGQPYYFRLIIPLEKELDLHNYIAFKTFTTDLGFRSSCGTGASINEDFLQACIVNKDDKKKYYLSIESELKQDYETFSEKTHAFKNAIGYISGHLPANAGYFFAYNSKKMEVPNHFCFREWRNTIISSYQPILANPFGYIQERRIAEIYYKKKLLRPMLITEFSRLCQQLFDSKEFTGVVILILEASVASLLFMPSGYAVALETMADLVIGKQKVDRSLIEDKDVRERIISNCKTVIENESIFLNEENKRILIEKLKSLNQGTNASRLRAPFDILDISLSDNDLVIINTRNDFLHGRVPDILKVGIDRPESRKGKDMYYASVRLYTLLNRLILKWIGYENYILNHARIQEEATGVKLKEDYYYKC